MAEEREKKLKALKSRQTLVSASLSNAVNQIKAGKVVSAGIISELQDEQDRLKTAIARLESDNDVGAPLAAPGMISEQGAASSTPIKDTEEDFGIPEQLRIKRRPYTMSEAAKEQRRTAANSPAKSEAMQGNNNAWKTGQYAKGFIKQIFRPCKSTCPQYPCALVDDGETEPGAACLDKVQVVKNIQAIQKAITTGDLTDFKDLASVKIAGLTEVLQMLIEDVAGENTILKSEIFDKEGVLLGHKIVSHPSLLPMIKLAEQLEMSPSNFLATPLIVKKTKTEEKKAKTLSSLMSGFGLGESPVDDDKVETAEDDG